jgi:hypothetical protein
LKACLRCLHGGLEGGEEALRGLLGGFTAEAGEGEGLGFDLRGEGLDLLGEFGVEGFELWMW